MPDKKTLAELLAKREFEDLPDEDKRARLAAGRARRAAMHRHGVESYRALLEHYAGSDGVVEHR